MNITIRSGGRGLNPFRWGHRPIVIQAPGPEPPDPKIAMRDALKEKQAQREALVKQLAALDSEIIALIAAIAA